MDGTERDRSRVRLATIVATISVVVGVAGVLFLAASAEVPVTIGWGFRGFPAIFWIAGTSVGWLIASRRPNNRVGWLFLLAGIQSSIQLTADSYTVYVLQGRGAGLPGGEIAAWIDNWVWVSGVVVSVPLVGTLYPDGHLLSPRWHLAIAAAFGGLLMTSTALALQPGPMQTLGVRNPFGLESFAGPIEAVLNVGYLLVLVSVIAAIAALVVRLRRARDVERRQIEWIAFAAMPLPLALPIASFGPNPQVQFIAQVIAIVAFGSVPVAAAVAILRYRLYDIDLLLNRTFVYIPLTALLAGLYAASIAVTQRVFVAVTGDPSDGAVVLSTLLLASTFTPIKNALQNVVDRRFRDPRDLGARLRAFIGRVDASFATPEPDRVLRAFLYEAVADARAVGGSISKDRDGRPSLVAATTGWTGPTEIQVDFELANEPPTPGRRTARLELGGRLGGRSWSERDQDAIRATVHQLAATLAGRADGRTEATPLRDTTAEFHPATLLE